VACWRGIFRRLNGSLMSENAVPITSDPLTSSVADFPARMSARPASAPGSMASAADSGATTPESWASYDHDTCSWRTSQGSLFGGWVEFSGSWPRSGMTRSGRAFLRPPLVPLTSVIGSGYWPTPDASCGRPHEGNVRLLRAAVLAGEFTEDEAIQLIGKSPLEAQGKIPPYYPTPRADSRDNCGGSGARKTAQRNGTYIGRKENPQFREWLMGFPIGWTEIPRSATPSSPKSLSGSSSASRKPKRHDVA
jgi:hypothetical protein